MNVEKWRSRGVLLNKAEYDALVSANTRNQELLGIYLNALRYMVRLYSVPDEAIDKRKRTEVALVRLLREFGLENAEGEA
jgi:hypothetical protein